MIPTNPGLGLVSVIVTIRRVVRVDDKDIPSNASNAIQDSTAEYSGESRVTGVYSLD